MIPFPLLPRYFKFIGLFIYILGFILHYYFQPNILDSTNGISILIQLLILIGLLAICNARQIHEDEFIQHCRLKSLQYAVLIFVLLRVFFKIMVWITGDIYWSPQFQVNFLLQTYLVLFYYQVFLKDILISIFKSQKN